MAACPTGETRLIAPKPLLEEPTLGGVIRQHQGSGIALTCFRITPQPPEQLAADTRQQMGAREAPGRDQAIDHGERRPAGGLRGAGRIRGVDGGRVVAAAAAGEHLEAELGSP